MEQPPCASVTQLFALYADTVAEGVAAGVYGRERGYPDVIPLLCNSMGVVTEDLICARFKVMDLLSSSPTVKGVGYYIGTNAFADARWMVGISQVHTLVADVEDYYVTGRRKDALVKCEPVPESVQPIIALDESGNQTTITPQVDTACRVHLLNRQGRKALITLVSHSNQGAGQKLHLTLDLKALGAMPGCILYDHLAGQALPLTPEITVDTATSGSLAVLEITETVPPA